jgi:YD repeat-containing protein
LTDCGQSVEVGEIYPDSDDTYSIGEDGAPVFSDGADETYDRIEFNYNRQGEVTEIKDQNETVHALDYDKLGRQTQDRVSTLGTGVEGAVRRIASTFEVRGMREKITSYDNATVGSGGVVNEVQFAYNDFGQITHDYQAHGGTVNTSTTPKVQYGYASGSANTIRPTAITYPDGRVITYDYGTVGGMNDSLSRISAIVDDDTGSTHLADYSYLGLGAVGGLLPTVNLPFTPGAVEVDYTEPDIRYTLVGTAGGTDPDTGDIYRGYDRFGNRLWREDTVAASYGKDLDELYGYDLIDRLKTMDRGDLDNQKSKI